MEINSAAMWQQPPWKIQARPLEANVQHFLSLYLEGKSFAVIGINGCGFSTLILSLLEYQCISGATKLPVVTGVATSAVAASKLGCNTLYSCFNLRFWKFESPKDTFEVIAMKHINYIKGKKMQGIWKKR